MVHPVPVMSPGGTTRPVLVTRLTPAVGPVPVVSGHAGDARDVGGEGVGHGGAVLVDVVRVITRSAQAARVADETGGRVC